MIASPPHPVMSVASAAKTKRFMTNLLGNVHLSAVHAAFPSKSRSASSLFNWRPDTFFHPSRKTGAGQPGATRSHQTYNPGPDSHWRGNEEVFHCCPGPHADGCVRQRSGPLEDVSRLRGLSEIPARDARVTSLGCAPGALDR